MRHDVEFSAFFPDTILVWSDIVGRSAWCLAHSVDMLNKVRIKVNKEVAKYVVRNGGLVVNLLEFEGDNWIYLSEDGVHLNAIGTDMWLLSLQEGIQSVLSLWPAAQV